MQKMHRRNNPSFSSSLLDAIYRSIDESDGSNLPSTNHKAPEISLTYTQISPPVIRLHHFPSAAASDAESATFPPKSIRTDRILTRTDRIRTEPLQEMKKNKKKSIKKKLQDLKNSTSPKLAGFLNSLFAPSAATTKKQKITAADEPSPSPSPSSASTSTYSRSCLSKTPSTRGSDGSSKRSVRSVRFCPVGVIVGEDCRKCGEKFVFDGEMTAVTAAERKVRLIEELMRGFETEEEDESDGSEDLFELENLGGVSAKFTDELPVYETTDLGMNCAIAKGLVV